MSSDRRQYNFMATDATRQAIWLRAGICGAGGSGKTYSALAIACKLAERLDCGPVFTIDTEHGSALRYAYSPRSQQGFKFKHVPMPVGDYSPHAYMAAFDYVIKQGARVVLVDSLSHEWDGAGGCLEMVDAIAERAERSGKKPDNFSAWRTVTPIHREFMECLLSLPAHVIFTLRAKTTYEQRKDEKTGRLKFEETGLGPVQREGIKYEPDLFFWMHDAVLTVDKTRCDRLKPMSQWEKPGADFAGVLAEWILDADPAQPKAPESPPPVRPSLESVTDKAIEAGIKAAKERSADAYTHAKRTILGYCQRFEVPDVARDAAVERFKIEVAKGAGMPSAAPTPSEPGDTAGAGS